MSATVYVIIGVICAILLIAIIVHFKEFPLKAPCEEPVKNQPPRNWEGIWAHTRLGPGWVKVIEGYNPNQEDLYYEHKSYTFIGHTEATMDSVDLLPKVENGVPILCYNENTLFGWTGEYWVASNNTNTYQYPGRPRHLRYAGYTPCSSDGFYVNKMTPVPSQYSDYEQSLFKWTYMLGQYPENDNHRDVVSYLLYMKYHAIRSDLPSVFSENLTKAPTSAIVAMAEEVIDMVVQDSPYIQIIRSELELRLKNMETIIKTKELLFN